MDSEYAAALYGLPLGPLCYRERLGSTNDEAVTWADQGASDLALVIADEQTAGRGRLNRRWLTPAGTALAFSLVLRDIDRPVIPACTALGALAVAGALQRICASPIEIKWPNDVLLSRRKVCGILAEAYWQGDHCEYIILGIGVNVTRESIPPLEDIHYPATCVEDHLGSGRQKVDRPLLLRSILTELLSWRPLLGSTAFYDAWNLRLAFRGEQVQVDVGVDPAMTFTGKLLGLDVAGNLLLDQGMDHAVVIQAGEIRASTGL